MVLHLHSTRLPSGHCLLLAQAIDRVSKSSRSTHIAEELCGKYPTRNRWRAGISDEKPWST